MQGWRTTQEDAHITTKIEQADGKDGMLIAVFDGHGGRDVSKFVEKEFISIFINT
jgi:serine/threonine protein phosphatase PrpC